MTEPSARLGSDIVHDWTFDALGTGWTITVGDPIPNVVADAVTAELARIDRTWSRFRDDSIVAQASRQAGRYAIAATDQPLVDWYRALYDATAGAVTPFVGQTLVDAGYDAQYSLVPAPTVRRVPAWDEVLHGHDRELLMTTPAVQDREGSEVFEGLRADPLSPRDAVAVVNAATTGSRLITLAWGAGAGGVAPGNQVATLAQGQRTILEYSIPDADWQGGRLSLWLGLHDYHARKTAVGPAQVVVDLDQGARRVPLTVEVAQGFGLHELALPTGPVRPVHVLRIELSAASAQNHFVGLHGELRR